MLKQKQPLLVLLAASALSVVAGCSSQSSDTSKYAGSPAVEAPAQIAGTSQLTPAQLYDQQVQSVNTRLNADDNYALTPADLKLLHDQNLLADADSAALAPLVRK